MNRFIIAGLAAAMLAVPTLGSAQARDITFAQFLRGEAFPLTLDVDAVGPEFMALTITVPGEGNGMTSLFSPFMMMGMFSSGG